MRLYPLFDQEGDIGGGGAPEAPEFTPEPSSVATEDYSASGDGNAPTPATEGAVPAGEVERQQSFAQRLKEQTDKRLAEERAKWEQENEAIRQENAYLDKIAQMNGFRDRNEYKAALDQHLKQQEIEREAQRMGMDPESYMQYIAPVNDELSQLRQEVQSFRQQQEEAQRKAQETQAWQSLYQEHPELIESSEGFKAGKPPEWFNKEMQDYMGMGYQPLHAYKLANQDAIVRKKEQEVLARLTGRDQTQVLSSVDSPNNYQLDPANMSFEQIEEISKRVRRGERITF